MTASWPQFPCMCNSSLDAAALVDTLSASDSCSVSSTDSLASNDLQFFEYDNEAVTFIEKQTPEFSQHIKKIEEFATGFEGCEKKLEMDFVLSDCRVDLRSINRSTIDAFLTLARCTIISTMSNQFCDSYVLSESSLFIYPTKVILKTCGTTRLLRALPAILEAAKAIGAKLDFLQFSRSSFMFPHKQKFPHRAFPEEIGYLNEQMCMQGHAHVLGSINGPRWHLYVADFNHAKPSTFNQQSLEIIMFNLDPNVMKTFYKAEVEEAENEKKCESLDAQSAIEEKKIGEKTLDGPEATRVSGIQHFLPGAVIDSFLFSPCGYSCNGLLDGDYFTIHITPEPQCSFVSFETNADVQSYHKLVDRVVSTFKPAIFCVAILADVSSKIGDSRRGLDGEWDVDAYAHTGVSHHTFPNGYTASAAQYVSVTPPPYAHHPMQMVELKKLYESAAAGVEWSKYQALLDHANRVTAANNRLSERVQKLETDSSTCRQQLADALEENKKLKDFLANIKQNTAEMQIMHQ